MTKPKIILFGTGNGGKNGFKYLKRKFQILGFTDNDSQKQGTTFMGLPVFAPSELEQMEFDQVIICSMYQGEIQDQLNMQLNIPLEKIDMLDPDIRTYGAGNPIGCFFTIIVILAAATYGACKLIAWIRA